MRIHNYYILTGALLMTALISGCQENEELPNKKQEPVQLSFSPVVENMEIVSKATNSFFQEKDKIDIKVTSSKDTSKELPFTYTYGNDGIFKGAPGFYFNLGDEYLTKLTASWPVQENRKEGIMTDQRKVEGFKFADWLTAEGDLTNIMPTAEPVPLKFHHQNCRLYFELAGQNAHGLSINSLILELQYQKPGADKPEETAFWAYCHDGVAELILDPSISIKSPDRYMIGRINVGGTTNYTGSIYFPKLDLDLKPGYSYKVTLTPEGCDLDATIHLGGFGQAEGFIGIPIQMPTPLAGETDTYVINNSNQLTTLSWIIKGWLRDEDSMVQNADTWKGYTYYLADNFVMTDNAALYFQTLPVDMKGQIVGWDKEPIFEVITESGTLALYQ